jgi:hypothetical protein
MTKWPLIRCVHLKTGADGRSHVEYITIPPGIVQQATAVHFQETPAGSTLDWHTGETFVLRPGEVLLAADTTGTGHRWRLIDDQPWRRVYVELRLTT